MIRFSENTQPPLIAHVIQRLAIGGLENGLINLINHSPPDRFRHVIISLTESTAFSRRIKSQKVPVIELNKASGKDFGVHLRLWRVLRQLKPDIVHTRNLPTLEFQITAALAGVKGRIHGEHGRDIYDLDGKNLKYNLLRRAVRPFVGRYTAVSRDLFEWLIDTVGVKSDNVTQIYNGVDAERFNPWGSSIERACPEGFITSNSFVVGTVGRMEAIKDQLTLVRAFNLLIQNNKDACNRMRLMIIGDGSLRQSALKLLRDAHSEELAWLPGDRDDVPELMRSMDLFVLPSQREGISNTILESMASGLPVVATNVGGNPELVEAGFTGVLVPHSDPDTLAVSIRSYFDDPAMARAHGYAGRQRVMKHFSMEAMVAGYLQTYDSVLKDRRISLSLGLPTAGGNALGS